MMKIPEQYRYRVAIIYAIALFLDRLDLTIVNITLPSIAESFHVPITSVNWINLSFLLALSISIPIGCWLGKRFGYKKIYISAMMLFGLSSTLCAWAPNIPTLLVLRFFHGIGDGLLIPVGMTLLYRAFKPSEYASITSFTFLPALIAPAIAPFLGGVILDVFNWKMVFLLSGPISLILAIIASLYLIEDKEAFVEPLDWQGFILFAAILFTLFYTLSLDGERILVTLIVGCLLLSILIGLFIRREKTTSVPLIDLSLFSKRSFVKANLIQICFQMCHFGAIYIIGVYLQLGVGMSASMAGFVMGMQALGAMAVSRYSVKLFNVSGAKTPITIGLCGVAILSPCLFLISNAKMIGFAALLFLVRGVFSGLCGSPIQTLSLVNMNKEDIPSANTIFNACRQISISLGIAVSSALLGIGYRFTHLAQNNYVIEKQHLFNLFCFGLFAITVIAGCGVLITQTLSKNESSIYL